ncbi:MAG: ABC transporter substrate-binding protein [Clostridium sp.]
MKKFLPLLMALTLTAASLTGCASGKTSETTAASTSAETSAETSVPSSEAALSSSAETLSADTQTETGAIRVGSLKGPTSMGLVSLMNSDSSANTYDFSMVTAADELVAMVASGKTDIALVPANIASVLYNKTEGGISVIDINTLGVLDIVSSDASIKSTADLKGKTIYMTGKGTTPDYVLHYLLKANGLTDSDVTLEYKSEPTEVAAVLKEKEGAVGLLPQPFVTAACVQNEALKIVLDLTKEWNNVQGENGSRLITGVTIVRNDFLKDNADAVQVFLSDHKVSAELALSNPAETADLIVKAGIIEKAPIAKKALPYCNITYIDGEEMKTALSGYLTVLFEQDPKSVGGKLPDDNFYYIAK